MKIVDLSLTIDNNCQTCGTPWHTKVKIEPLGRLDTVGRNTSKLVLGSHSATHMDAPLHFISDGHDIAATDLNKCIGLVTCVDLRHIKANGKVEIADIKHIAVTKRMLFVFSWCKYWQTDKYYSGYPYFAAETIDYLIANGMKLMAMDTPSPDNGKDIKTKDNSPNHKKLLANDIVIVEYLTNTKNIDFNKSYEIVALPLKIAQADGSPARVVLKEVE